MGQVTRSQVAVSIMNAPPESGFKFVATIINRVTGKTLRIYNDSKSMLRLSARAAVERGDA